MTTFSFTSPDGKSYDIDGPEGSTKEQAFSILQQKLGTAAPAAPIAQDPRLAGAMADEKAKYEDMPFYEKMGRGAVGDVKEMYRGAKELVGQESPADVAAGQNWKRESEGLGGWGTVGGLAGQAVATLPLAYATGGTGNALLQLPRAGKYLQAAAQIGGKYLNLGRAAAAGTEGALSAGINKPQEGDTRLGNMATAGAVGAGAPTVLTGIGAAVKPVYEAVVPTMKNAASRAYKTFEKTLGKERLADVEQKIRTAPESRVPLTTAATADDPYVGAMEGGARTRNNPKADFQSIDTAQAVNNWNNIVNDTTTLLTPEHLAKRADKLRNAGSSALDKFRIDDGGRTVLQNEIDPILHSNEVWQNPLLKKEVSNVLGALQTPNLSAQGLKVHYDRLEKYKDIPAIAKVRESIHYAGNAYSDDLFSKIDDVATKATKAADEAKAARAVRRRFKSDEGTVAGDTGVYNVGGEQIPAVKGGQLRDAIRAQESKLDPQRQADLSDTIESLRRRELFDPTANVGGSKLDIGDLRGPVSRAVSSTGAWKARPLVDLVTGAANRKTMDVVDTALADPKKFIALMDAKKLRNEPLTQTERMTMNMIINTPARLVGANQGE